MSTSHKVAPTAPSRRFIGVKLPPCSPPPDANMLAFYLSPRWRLSRPRRLFKEGSLLKAVLLKGTPAGQMRGDVRYRSGVLKAKTGLPTCCTTRPAFKDFLYFKVRKGG